MRRTVDRRESDAPDQPLSTPSRSLGDLFESVARRHPDRLAIVVDGVGSAYTPREVDELSRHIAGGILDHAGPGSRIGIGLARSAWVPITILGVLRAGCSYVPLDPSYPAARLRFMVEDSGVRLVVTDGS